MNAKVLYLIFTILLCLFSLSPTYAQKKYIIGINISTNIYPDQIEWENSNFGATFESKFTKHSGGETGLFYRTERTSDITSYTDATGTHIFSFTIARRYITLPVLYKYYSKIINFSVGPAFDFYVGWRQKQGPVPIRSYSVSPKIRVGFLTKLSRNFPINDKFFIEPEIRFGSVQTFDEVNLGIGIAGKYRF